MLAGREALSRQMRAGWGTLRSGQSAARRAAGCAAALPLQSSCTLQTGARLWLTSSDPSGRAQSHPPSPQPAWSGSCCSRLSWTIGIVRSPTHTSRLRGPRWWPPGSQPAAPCCGGCWRCRRPRLRLQPAARPWRGSRPRRPPQQLPSALARLQARALPWELWAAWQPTWPPLRTPCAAAPAPLAAARAARRGGRSAAAGPRRRPLASSGGSPDRSRCTQHSPQAPTRPSGSPAAAVRRGRAGNGG